MSTKDRIQEVALRAFATHGYEGTTLAQIANEVGIQKPSLYNHYKNKDELYLTVADFIMKALVEQIETSSLRYKEEQLSTRLKLVLKESCEFIIQKQEGVMYKRFMLFPPVELKKEAHAIVKQGDADIDLVLTDLYQHGQEEGSLKNIPLSMFSSAYYCLLDGLFTESFIYEDHDFQRRFTDAWTVFWYGISKEQSNE